MSFTVRTHPKGKDLLTTEFSDVARAAANGIAYWHRNMDKGEALIYQDGEYHGRVDYVRPTPYTYRGKVT